MAWITRADLVGLTGPGGPAGAKGDKGDRGEQGLPGAEGLATAEAFAQHVELPGPGRDALEAAFARTLGGKVLAKAMPVRGLQGVKRALETGVKTTGLQVLGDSTGNDPIDWPYRLAQSLAPMYPAYSVHHRLWNDATQDWGAPTVIQTGTAGVQYLDCSTVGINGLTAPGVHPTSGNLDVRLKLNMPDWTPGSAGALVARSGGAGFHSWWLNLTATGALQFVHSPDGTNLLTDTSTTTIGAADGSDLWVRVVFIASDAGNRYVKFYTSTNGTAWTALGTFVTAAASTLFSPAATGGSVGGRIEFGGRGAVAIPHKLYEAQIRDGENGPTMTACLPGLWEPHPLSLADSVVVGAPIFTIVNASHPGATLAYLADSVRLPRLMPRYGQTALITNASHNEGTAFGSTWLESYRTFLTAAVTRLRLPVTVLTQNPQTPAAPYPPGQLARRLDLLGLADERSVIDTYQAFLDYGPNWIADLMADSVHPNAAGQNLWRDVILAHWNAS